MIQDRATGRSKGFGFVEMDTEAQAQAAIEGLHDQEHDGRRLTVNEAKPREDRGGGGGYGGGGGGAAAVVAAAAVTATAAAAVVMAAVAAAGVIDLPSKSVADDRENAHENALSHSGTAPIVVLSAPPPSRPSHSFDARASPLLFTTGRHWMNPKHFHTPVSTRLRCPVCHQPVYSRGGIHPQCAIASPNPPCPDRQGDSGDPGNRRSSP